MTKHIPLMENFKPEPQEPSAYVKDDPKDPVARYSYLHASMGEKEFEEYQERMKKAKRK